MSKLLLMACLSIFLFKAEPGQITFILNNKFIFPIPRIPH